MCTYIYIYIYTYTYTHTQFKKSCVVVSWNWLPVFADGTGSPRQVVFRAAFYSQTCLVGKELTENKIADRSEISNKKTKSACRPADEHQVNHHSCHILPFQPIL